MTYKMPAETIRHERTWMAFPVANYVLGNNKFTYREGINTWSTVANAIQQYEPVSMLVDPSMESIAVDSLNESINRFLVPLDDSWLRYSGPSFFFTEGHASQ